MPHIEVKFRSGYHAARSNRRNTQEWPPTPARLFSALVNGYYDLTRAEGDQPECRRALEWLEGHLPEVRFPDAVEPVGECKYTAYVPIPQTEGLKKDKQGITGRCFLWPYRIDRSFPAVYPEQPYVFYSWPGLEGPWGAIQRMANEVYYFGTSRSQATIRVVDDLPEVATEFNHYAPAGSKSPSDLRLFVYYPGRLKELDACYDNGLRASPNARPYTRVCPPKAQPHMGMFSECLVYRIVGRKLFDVTSTALVADAFRSEMLGLCDLLGVQPPSVVAHDDQHPHLAYLPLAFVGRYYYKDRYVADNLIAGICVGIPHGLSTAEVQEVKRLLSTLDRFRYCQREFGVIPVGGDDLPRTLQLSTWAGPATTWATVTPCEVRWRTDNNQYIREHCEQLKLPEVVNLQTHGYGLFGPSQARDFVSRNEEKGRQSGFRTHAVIEFKEPVTGPLTLGRTRNFGLGLLRPLHDWTWGR